jgi:hypothetical protein
MNNFFDKFIDYFIYVLFGIIILFIISLFSYSNKNVEDIKKHSNDVWNKNGFEVIGYEGYQWTFGLNRGGCVYYLLTRKNITYEGCISKYYNGEYFIYNIKALDALSTGNQR